LEKPIAATKNVMGALAKTMDKLLFILTCTQGVESAVGEGFNVSNRALEAPTLWSSISLLSGAIVSSIK
jgi:hypothetical protein